MLRLKPPRQERDVGASFVEYAALIVFVGIILVVLVTSGVASQLSERISVAIDDILPGQEPDEAAPPAPGESSEGTGDGALGEEGNPESGGPPNTEDIPASGSGSPHVETNEYGDPEFFTADLNDPAYWYDPEEPHSVIFAGNREDPEPLGSGDPDAVNGIGEPVEGESAAPPDLPSWSSNDEGAGEWDSYSEQYPELKERYYEKMVPYMKMLSRAARVAYPDAAKNLTHYFENSGEPLEQNVDKMIRDLPNFEEFIEQEENKLIDQALEAAMDMDASGPVTFPVGTSWEGYNYDSGASEDRNWFYAVGEFDYAVNGTVTVYPPSGRNDEWTFSSETEVHMRDQYNWDGDKATTFPFFGEEVTISDKEIGLYHLFGLAQEYTIVGNSGQRNSEG